jgi:hypothetical protein
MIQQAAITLPHEILYSTFQPRPQEPHSAVTQLIQGIYEQYPDEAIRILRRPIWVNYVPSILCRSMIAIAAKRYSVMTDWTRLSDDLSLPWRQVIYTTPPESPRTPSAMDYGEALVWLQGLSSPKQVEPRYRQDRSVRAVLLNANNQVLLWAENENSRNKTKHAEVQLLQKHFAMTQEGLSEPTTLISSLQCCKMCAGLYWSMHTYPWAHLRAAYIRPEIGPSARDTIFTPNGNFRREFYNDPGLLHKQVEFTIDSL